MPKRKKFLVIPKRFCPSGRPYNEVPLAKRTVDFKSGETTLFHQDGVELPVSWSDLAAFIVTSKYFRGHVGEPEREHSIRQLLDRVADTIADHGKRLGYFDGRNAKNFASELKKLMLDQRLAFNSPVYFNLGAEPRPQVPACFVMGLEDNLDSIAMLQVHEIKIFSQGSGAGSNLSNLRSFGEPLSRGGRASGPLSFMRAYDAWAGIIKSGGTQRRASKLQRLDIDHPDVYNGKEDGSDFISFKAREEEKARVLVNGGVTIDEAYATVSGQNCNLTVGVTDAFMKAALEKQPWSLKYVLGKKTARTFPANQILDSIAANAWKCGDPGLQFDDRMNEWNSVPKFGKIRGTNPCSEVCAPDNNACNLLSLNLLSFISAPDGIFFEEEFEAAVRIGIIAQDILTEISSYPTPEIDKNSKALRPLGMGFCNLGGLVMSLGLPYDSEAARTWASGITALMTAAAFTASMEIAEVKGSFSAFEDNRKAMVGILRKHKSRLEAIMEKQLSQNDLMERALILWNKIVQDVHTRGVRNSQVTLVAPTGTIGIMMDAATGGIEPPLMLTMIKRLASGGELHIVNSAAKTALDALHYTKEEQEKILKHIEENGTIEGSAIREHDLTVFDCAYPSGKGTRFISPMGHLMMMASVQPLISGSISKTVGCPHDATVDQIRDIYINAWKMGLKAVTVYRQGSKIIQPLEGTKGEAEKRIGYHRTPMPKTRSGETRAFQIGGVKGYFTINFFPGTKRPGELFVTLAKEGSTLRGLMDCFVTAISICLQSGVPIDVLADKFTTQKFEPQGITGDPEIPIATSIVDYIFRYIRKHYIDDEEPAITEAEARQIKIEPQAKSSYGPSFETCPVCGNMKVRTSPTCSYCPNQCPGQERGTCGG